MRDLKEITCEKCKASLAKKMIKADKKEMALLLKEEKKREKMGIGDERCAGHRSRHRQPVPKRDMSLQELQELPRKQEEHRKPLRLPSPL